MAGDPDGLPGWWFRHNGDEIYWLLTESPGPEWRGLMWCAVGAVLCVLLGIMRLRFWWWPFNPVGYILANGMMQAVGTFPFLIAWSAKSLVIRYGGLHLYRKTVPLAVGLIVGDVLNRFLWNIITLATRGAM